MVHSTTNVCVFPPEFGIGATNPLTVKADNLGIREIVDGDTLFGGPASLTLRITDVAGNFTACDPIVARITAEVPENFLLEQNYPSPFNPIIVIPFQLAEEAVVELAVYDALGREVVTLIDKAMTPGSYEVTWDGPDDVGGR